MKELAPVLNTAALVSIMLKKSTFILMKLLTLQSITTQYETA